MDRIDLGHAPPSGRRDRFFARSAGTRFAATPASGSATEIDLYDEIGFWGVTAKDFRARLRDAGGDVVLRINSPGGDVFDGIAIHNDLVAHKGKVRVEVTGVAASAASLIAMAGDEIVMADNAFLMIHNAWTIGLGDRHDFAAHAEMLGKVDDALARTYAARSGVGIRTVKTMMDDETWLTGKEAREQGFATATAAAAQASTSARFDLSVFKNPPAALSWDDDGFSKPETEEDIEKLLMRDAGWTRSQARALVRDVRAGKTSTTEAMPGAGHLQLGGLAAAVRAAAGVSIS